MPAFPSTGLRFRLMLLVVLSMLPMFGLLLYHAAEDRQKKLGEIQEDAARMAELAARSVSQLLEGTRQMLHTVAFTEPVRTGNGPESSALFIDLLRHSANYRDIGLTQPDGITLASAVPGNILRNNSKEPWFERLQERRNFCLGQWQIREPFSPPALVVAYPLPGQGDARPLAAIYTILDLEALQRSISRLQLLPDIVIGVVDRNGIELARNPDAAKWVGREAKSWQPYRNRANPSDAFVEAVGVDGTARLYHYVPVLSSDNGLFVFVGIPKGAILSAIRASFLRELAFLVAVALAALGCAWYFANASVIQHVRRLITASRQLAEGKWSTKAQLDGGARELQQLGKAFDEMAAALRQNQDRLEERVEQRTRQLSQSNKCLKQEIEERLQAEAASQKLLADLERSNRELEQFAYVASHDLQEPLRLVSAYTQLLLQRYRDKLDSGADPMVRFITEGVARMQQLIQDLLAYSRVSSQGKPLALADVDAPLQAALLNLEVAIKENHAVITHDPLPCLHCDPAQLRQLFQNLIANSIKFHGPQPPLIHIGIGDTQDGAAWLFTIRDNGIGIDPDYFERIFVIFQRLHTRAKYPGTGIGLAICKRIVEHHGGRIWVQSAKGEGSTFFFTIPKKSERL